MDRIIRFIQDEEAVAAIEYALMLALIIAVAAGAVRSFGNTSDGAFATILDAIDSL
jgi:Flp pilus assembly pilin Flp